MTAKGVEDTAFYVYNRLVSLNEVGGEPGRFGVRPEAVHALQPRTGRPDGPMPCRPSSTHDTKRSEDVRARINVLSEMPEDWWAVRGALEPAQRAAPQGQGDDDQTIPDANEEYLLYQTLVGAWPLEPYGPEEYAEFVERIQDYMLKALHEAKVHTSWINPNAEYDEAIQRVRRPHPRRGRQPPVPRRLPRLPAPDQPLRAAQLAVADAAEARLAGRAGHLPGDRAVGLQPGGPGQPPAGGLRASPADARGPPVGRRDRPAATCATWPGTWSRPRKTAGSSSTSPTGRSPAAATTPGSSRAGEYIPLAAEGSKAAHLFAFARRAGDVRRRRRGAAPRRPAGPRPGRPPIGRRGLAGHPAAPDRPRPGPPLAASPSPARS